MAFSHVKVAFSLASTRGDKTTEAFYATGTTIPPNQPLTEPLIRQCLEWVDKRKATLCPTWYIHTCRISPAPIPGSNEDSPRIANSFPIANGTGSNLGTRDTPNVVLNLKMRSTTGHVRNLPLHGLPDNAVLYDADGQQVLGIANVIQQYGNYLAGTTSPWLMRVEKVPFNSALALKIGDITIAAGTVTFTVKDQALQLAPGQKFLVSACKGFKTGQFDGHWVVGTHDLTAKTITCQTRRLIDPEIFYSKNTGTFRVEGTGLYDFERFLTYEPTVAKAGTRKVGNGQDGHRGRRSVTR